MGCTLPFVLAADAVGPGMLIRHTENGLLTPVDDPEAMAQTIRYLLENDDERAGIARAGHADFERTYSEPVVIRQYIALFEKFLAERPS